MIHIILEPIDFITEFFLDYFHDLVYRPAQFINKVGFYTLVSYDR